MTAIAVQSSAFAGYAWFARMRDRLLFASVLASFLVMVDPSPNEVVASVGFIFLLAGGLSFPRSALPLLWLLIGLDLGGAFAALPIIGKDKVATFAVISFFLGFYALYFVALLSERTLIRLDLLRRAWVLGGLAASLAGIAGYFNIAGTHDLFTMYGARVKGTFNDPNVFGPFLVMPMLLLAQHILLGDPGRQFVRLGELLILTIALFLSFSRAAWGHAVFSLLMMVLLHFITTQSARLRTRIIAIAILSLAGLAAALIALMAIPDIQALFFERASLTQSYDTRRFGNYLNALDVILDNPMGIGPFEFALRFFEDPHNAYIHTFISYGWIGGFCYLAIVACTLMQGWATVWIRSPLQRWMIPAICCFTGLAGVSSIIHSDHWRHFFVLLGMVWALAAAIRDGRAPSGGVSMVGHEAARTC